MKFISILITIILFNINSKPIKRINKICNNLKSYVTICYNKKKFKINIIALIFFASYVYLICNRLFFHNQEKNIFNLKNNTSIINTNLKNNTSIINTNTHTDTFNLHKLIENNNDESIQLRKKIEKTLNKQISHFITYLNNNNDSIWEISKNLYNINIIGEIFAHGSLKAKDKERIISIFSSLRPDIQNILSHAILEIIREE